MIALRNVMGLRSPVHTLARLLNPLDAPFVMQAIFHPAYRESHQSAAALLGYRNSCVIKGEGGEIERNPDGLCLAKRIVDGALQDEEWPMLFPLRHAPEEEFVMDDFLAVWRGEKAHEYGEMAVVATVALALRTLQRADSQDAAMAMARAWWEARDRHAPASPR
jgi:anthranilate phosphoribosyltransferase